MKLSIYSIYDTVAEVFNKPFVSTNDATAIRDFKTSVVEQIHKNDYELYKLADYTDHDGCIVSHVPKRLMSGFDVSQLSSDVEETPQLLKVQNS